METKLDFSLDHPIYGNELLGTTGQLARASWLSKQVRDDDIFFMQDGILSQLLFKEVLSSFVAGQYIATIVLAFSLIERTVAGRLASVDEKSSAKSNSEKLFKNALARKWLNQEEYDLLEELRKLRNPIVHFHDHLSEKRPEVRAALNAKTTEQVLEVDAMKTLEATIHVLQKTAL